MKEVIAFNPPINWVKEKIEEAGTQMGSVHFIKRTDGSLRKMSYRLHVTNPSFANKPKGKKIGNQKSRKDINNKNKQMTVFDNNKVIRNEENKIIGRGAWRTVPLENVVRIKNRGTLYTIKNYE